MNIEKFINLVYEYKCLWDQSDKAYHLRHLQRGAWQEISEELKIPVDELKKKWRGLRDTFGKELKKVSNKKSSQSAETELDSRWPFFKPLLFLEGTMTRREPRSSVPDINEVSDTEDRSDDGAGASTSSHPSASSSNFAQRNNQSIPKKTFKSPLKRRLKAKQAEDIHKKILYIEQEKLRMVQQSANDPDAQFLMSLLPFLKEFPKNRNLIVRSKLLDVLIEEQNDTSSSLVQIQYSSD